jgi:hypothetical protein
MDYITQELGPESLSENAAMEWGWEPGNRAAGYDRPYRRPEGGCGCGCQSSRRSAQSRLSSGYEGQFEYEWERAPAKAAPPCKDPRSSDPKNIPALAPRRKPPIPTPEKIFCPDPIPNVFDPVLLIQARVADAIDMLDETIRQLVEARTRKCRGEPARLLARTAHFLRDRMSVCLDDIRVWTAGSREPIRSVAEVIRRLARVRNELATNQIRFTCDRTCDEGTVAWVDTTPIKNDTPRELVHLCPIFWRRPLTVAPSEFSMWQVQTIIHEVSHLTHDTDDPRRGRTVGVANCISGLVLVANGKRPDPRLESKCGPTTICGARRTRTIRVPVRA